MLRSILIPMVLLISFPVFGLEVQVNVKGLASDLEENVLVYLSVEQERSRKSLNEARLRLLHNKAENEIRQALQPYGYFQPSISSSLTKQDHGFVATYEVQPGAPMKIVEIDFQVFGEGSQDLKITEGFPLQSDMVLNQSDYDAAKQNLLSETIQRGYLDAKYTHHQILVDLESNSATIKLHLDTGAKLRFGEVRFNQKIMDPEFLARYVPFNSGDPFSQDALLNLQGQLIDSEYFKRVEVVSRRDQISGDRVPIDIDLKPNKRNRYRIGLGYSTDTGPRLKLDWKNRRVGRNGHRMRTEFLISEPIGSLSSEYVIPLERPTVDYIRFGASLEHSNSDTNQGDRALLNATHSISLDRGWRRSLGLEYSYEDFKIGEQEDTARLLVPSIDWLRIKRDSKTRIHRGKRLNFRIEGASDAVLSTASYFQLYASGKFIDGFGSKDWRLLSRIELGATWTEDLTELPPSKRFFAGGDNTVRGFGYEDLGPENESGDVVGGRYLAVGGIELDRRISDSWSGALFVDFGNAYDPDYDSETAYGVGFGIRWHSPVGPVRFDVASGSVGEERQWRLHVVVGPEL
ncbi:MAG: autotransporter assembly complex family protein [Candidatus Thiodiazotropha sp. 6PLUC2]